MSGVAAAARGASMRLDGWEARLAELVEAARQAKYELGTHDCFRLACRCIEALTGVDRWPAFAGYRSRREALLRIARHGESAEAAGDWFFGAPAVDVRLARRGDLCMLETADGEKHLGVCLGAETALLAPEGLMFIPTLTCLRAWRVG